MNTPREKGALRTEELTSDADLGRLLRRTLRGSIGREEPSPGVWQRALKEVEAERAESGRACLKGPIHARSATLAQAAVLVAMLLVFGFGIDEGARFTSEVYQSTPTVRTTETGSGRGSGIDDMLSGLRLTRSAKQFTIMDYRLAPFVECPR